MGNLLEAIEKELESSPLEDEQPETLAIEEEELENIIDLDSAEYKQWLQAKREREGRTQGAEKCLIRIGSHSYRVQPLSEQPQAATEAQISRLPKSNSQEFSRRSGDSERRIAEMRKKYNLTNRDYKRRGSVVLILDDKRALKGEKEQRQKMRQEMRRKYQLPSHRPRSQVTAG